MKHQHEITHIWLVFNYNQMYALTQIYALTVSFTSPTPKTKTLNSKIKNHNFIIFTKNEENLIVLHS